MFCMSITNLWDSLFRTISPLPIISPTTTPLVDAWPSPSSHFLIVRTKVCQVLKQWYTRCRWSFCLNVLRSRRLSTAGSVYRPGTRNNLHCRHDRISRDLLTCSLIITIDTNRKKHNINVTIWKTKKKENHFVIYDNYQTFNKFSISLRQHCTGQFSTKHRLIMSNNFDIRRLYIKQFVCTGWAKKLTPYCIINESY